MKLKTCHIENFGKITDTDFKFNASLTTFCRENGYGKTTLATFLKAMFYGLDSDRSNSAFNDRRHFYPFAGGAYGGYVTFEAGGKTYKIERFFDEKSETKDTLTIYCNGVVMPDFGEEAGEKFFGIDKPSFERTIFVSGTEIDIASTGSINTKLNNFVAGTGDDTNLEAAVSRLETKSKEYKKSRAGNDLITRETERINRLSEGIENATVIAKILAEKYARFDEKARTVAELNEKISVAQSENVVIANWENYDAMVADIAAKKNELLKIEANYPFGMPSREEIESVEKALERDRTLNAQSARKLFTDEDFSRYAALQAKFSEGVPTEEELSAIQEEISERDKLLYDLEKLENGGLTDKESRLMQKFAYRTPEQSETDKLSSDAERYKAAEEECAKIPDFITSTEYIAAEPKKLNKPAFLIMAAVSVLLILGGVAAVFFATVAGIALLAAGFVGLAATGFLYLNKKAGGRQSGQERSVQKENPEKLAARKKADEICAEIQAFLMPYGYSLEHGVPYAVASFAADVKEFKELKIRTEAQDTEIAEKTVQKRETEEKLTAFFAKYDSAAGNFVDRLSKLRSDIDTYANLKKRKQSAAADEGELKEKIAENRRAVIAFCQKYKTDVELIDDKIKIIAKDLDDYAATAKAVKEAEAKAARFKAEKNLVERTESEYTDLKALNDELIDEQDAKNALYTEIISDEREVEKLDDLKSEYKEAKERLEEYKANYDLLRKTVDSLKRADGNLKEKYIKPVRDRFLHYSDMLEKALGERITMNANFEVRYERNGKERSERHLSAGQRSICALCFRLALIDNMYSAEKPFIILDDPLVNLDEEHIGKAKSLLTQISEDLQIVYFACHSSRAI